MHLKMIESGVGGIELMIDGFPKMDNGRTDRRTDRRSDRPSCRDARTHLKRHVKFFFLIIYMRMKNYKD